MDEEVRRYIDAVDPAYRPLFDRVHRLIMAAYPEADVALSCLGGACVGGLVALE